MKEYGLALAGGGAKGAYQFGVWTALREMDIEIKGVVGTSIGALNGAAIIQEDYEALYELWHNLKASYVLNISDEVYNKIRNVDFASTSFSELFDEVKKTIDLEGVDITPLKDLIHSLIDEKKIRESGIDFGLVTVSLTDLEALELFVEDIPENQLKEYLLATAYLPFFRRERLHGKYYLDGMYHNNLPTNMLVSRGYTNIIEVHLKSKEESRPDYGEHVNIIEIKPSQPLGRALDFDQENSRKNIDLGYYDTLRAFKELAGVYYYFDLDVEAFYYIQKFHGFQMNTISKFYEILGIWATPQARGFFEDIIPELIKGLDLERDASYLDFIIAAYEHLGKEYELPRFQLYTFKDFTERVYKQARIKSCEQEEESGLDAIKNFFSKEQKITMALELMVCEMGRVEK